jgi:EmrB/QacA subfamily drug resistance transporter
VLVAARAVQGVGAAAMIPAALAVLLLDGPADKRHRAIALWSAASAVAAAVGPAVGGVLVDWVSWRLVFYINLPFGVAMLIAAMRILPRSERRAGGLPDPIGTLLFTVGVGAVTLGVTKGGTWNWTDPRTLGCLIGGAVATAIAVARSTRRPVPALETELWRNRTFLVANVVSMLYGMAQYPWLLGTVLYVTDVWRYGELRAGLAMTPGALAASAAALVVGRLTASRLRGPRTAVLVGLAMFLAGGVWIVPAMTAHPAYATLILPISIIAGAGMGLITYGTSVAAALSAPPHRFAGASGMNTMARQLGGALGVAALAVILESNAGHGLQSYRWVYLFCTVLVAIGITVSWAALRFAAPPAPAPPAPAGADGGDRSGVREAAAD